MTFSDEVWEATAVIRKAIDDLPFLTGLAAAGRYPALVAGLLPCFWVYDDVGRRLQHQVGDLSRHPYGDWVGTYGDPAFTASTVAARAILDRVADQAGAATRARMREAFTTATRYEWMFWDAAWRRETFLPA